MTEQARGGVRRPRRRTGRPWPATLVAVAVAVAVAVVAGAWSPRPAIAQTATLDEVLRRAGHTMLEFERRFGTHLADEIYEQRVLTSEGDVDERRRFSSQLLFFRPPAADTWSAYRLLRHVDGEPTGRAWIDSDRAIDDLDEFLEGARRTSRDAERHFVGRLPWSLHMPLLALTYLHPLNSYRSRFEQVGEAEVAGRRAWVVRFAEHRSPSFVRTRVGDLFASGRYWLDPETGQVLRSHLVLGGSVSSSRARTQVFVSYRYDPQLDVWVPDRMQERYDNPLFPGTRRTEGEAIYTNFRPFDLETELVGSAGR